MQAFKLSVSYFVQLLIDPSCLPPVIKACQEYGANTLNEIFKFSKYKRHKQNAKDIY